MHSFSILIYYGEMCLSKQEVKVRTEDKNNGD